MFEQASGGALGLSTRKNTRRFTVRQRNWTKGQVAAVDLANASGFATNTIEGHENSNLSNLVAGDGNHMIAGPLVVLDDNADQNTKVYAHLSGRIQARVGNGDGEIVKGSPLLYDNTTHELTPLASYGQRFVAIADESVSGSFSGDAMLVWVLFDGVYGVGQYF